MRVIKKVSEMRLFSRKAKARGKSVGLVPTMGALHEGHLSLVTEARNRCKTVVVSIFVNPSQFGPAEDFKNYPRDLRRDNKLLSDLEVDAVFAPSANEIYEEGFKTWIEVAKLSDVMCGRSRPGHFRGVATIVAKLFNIVEPDMAFFGEKDYQQLAIIKQLTRDLNLPVDVIALPTVREYDGLAMSSRNTYLSPVERKKAVVLYQALCLAKEMFAGGEKDARKIVSRMRSLIHSEPGLKIDYICAVDQQTLQDVDRLKHGTLIAVAAYIGKVRLIDNMSVS